MYKMVCSDLDETLLVNLRVPDFNNEAIQKIRDKVHFVITTGRPYYMITDILDDIDMHKEGYYSIVGNGGLIYENNDTLLHSVTLDYDKAKRIFDLGIQANLCTFVFTLDHCFIYNPDEYEVERKTQQHTPFTCIYDTDFTRYKNDNIVKIMLMNRDEKYLYSLKESISDLDVTVAISSNRYFDVTPSGITKAYGVKWLAHYLNIDTKDIICMGDNDNDITMLDLAGLGVAMTCADEHVRKHADYITVHDYDEGGVKEVLEKFLL